MNFKDKFLSNIPFLGWRAIKTSIAIFICMVVFEAINRPNPLYACIAAVLSMQNTLDDSIDIGVNRMIGTGVGGFLGIVFFIVGMNIPFRVFYLLFAAFGTLCVIYANILLKKPSAISISIVVFLVIMINIDADGSKNMMDAFTYAINRMLDTGFGIIVAVTLNATVKRYKIRNSENSE